MDSMRHLSTSLPPASGRRLRPEQAQDLLSDFKAAALSVTNLYKTAAAAQTKSRTAGYQDALDDLLAFLDQENMGLMDGEGWRVRRWATERLDDNGLQMQQRQPGSGDEEEDEQLAGKEEEVAPVRTEEMRSSSPDVAKKSLAVPSEANEPSSSPQQTRRVLSEPPSQQQQPPAQNTTSTPTLANFTFSSNTTYPTNHDREGSPNTHSSSHNMELDNNSTSTTPEVPRHVQHRATRTRNPRPRGGGGGSNTVNFTLGSSVGNKRKMPYPDFFDISGVNFDGNNGGNGSGHDRKDHGGGKNGKRGRFV